MEWISVKDRLPSQEYETVFCLCKKIIFIGTYFTWHGKPAFTPQEHFKPYVRGEEVTHWIPIPKLQNEHTQDLL